MGLNLVWAPNRTSLGPSWDEDTRLEHTYKHPCIPKRWLLEFRARTVLHICNDRVFDHLKDIKHGAMEGIPITKAVQ